MVNPLGPLLPARSNRTGPVVAGLLVQALCLIAGCADAGRPDSDSTVSRWDVELVTRFGSIDGADDALSRIGQVLITPDSTLLVSQPTNRLVLEYDWQGRLVRQIGRHGEGPGEFGAIRAIGILRDTLYVSDHALDRVNYFELQGEFIRSRAWVRKRLRLSDEYFFSTTPPQVLRADGTAILQPSMGLTPTRRMGVGINAAVYRTPYLHVGADSRIIDTVAWRESQELSVGVRRNGKDYFYPWPFAGLPRAGMAPDGTGVVVVARSSPDHPWGYRVMKLGPAGDTVFARTFAHEPVVLPAGHRDRALERLTARYREDDVDAPGPAEVRRAFEDAGLDTETAVPVTGLAMGRDGSIWVRREPGPPGSRVLWDVLDAGDGHVVGRVGLPEAEVVADSFLDHVVTSGEGDLGVPTVSLYRVRR